jgi:hypothetical protein
VVQRGFREGVCVFLVVEVGELRASEYLQWNWKHCLKASMKKEFRYQMKMYYYLKMKERSKRKIFVRRLLHPEKRQRMKMIVGDLKCSGL